MAGAAPPVALLVSSHTGPALDVAAAWARAGEPVTLVLLDAAAALARPGHELAGALRGAQRCGVTVLVHDEALRRRALRPDRLAEDVHCVDLDGVADLVTRPGRAVWW